MFLPAPALAPGASVGAPAPAPASAQAVATSVFNFTAPPTPIVPGAPWVAGPLYPYISDLHMVSDPALADNGTLWYVVVRGTAVGVIQDHAQALLAVTGISNNQMKGYKTLAQALFTFNHALDLSLVQVRPF
ncbi:hypothetical protein C8R46DRAFT_1233004 [Mycena filopes]|nr:hypothetical protein C8R46DRAFT_1233004 [Mycena filopes]